MDNKNANDFILNLLSLVSPTSGYGIAKEHAKVTLNDKGEHVVDWTEADAVLKTKMRELTAPTHDAEVKTARDGLFS